MKVKKSATMLVTTMALVVTTLGSASAEESPAPPDPSQSAEPSPGDETPAPEPTASEGEPAPEESAPQDDAEEPQSEKPQLKAAAAPTKVTLSPTSWTTVTTERVRGSVNVTANGEPAPGAKVQLRFTGSHKRTVTVTTNSAGRASYSVALKRGTQPLTAHVVASDKYQASKSSTTTLYRQGGKRVSIMTNRGKGTVVRRGENFWIRGKVLKSATTVHRGAKVTIYRYAGGKRYTSARIRANSDGVFSWSPPKRSAGSYRAKVSNSQVSVALRVKPSSGKRSLESRRDGLSFMLGAAQGGVKKAGNYRYQSFKGGLLMETPTQTRLVRGKRTRAEVHKRGGPAGSLGVPLNDARCGLPEGGCLQTFQKGSVYTNPKARQPITSALAKRTKAGDLVAVALSQVGYIEPARRKGKFNRWMGDTSAGAAWCGFFTAWTGYAAGKPGSVIKRNRFHKLAAAERKRGRTTKTPSVGRLAYFGSSPGKVHHTGIVTKVTKTHIKVVEGNVSGGRGSAANKGVFHQSWPRSRVAFYADPLY